MGTESQSTKGVASGLARLQADLADRKSLGLIPIDGLDGTAVRGLISRLCGRGCNYGVIKATGRNEWLIVRHGRLADLKAIGDEFERQTIIHVPEGGKKPTLRHDLKTGDHEVLGPGHKVLQELDIYELMAPPGGPLNRSWRPFDGELPPFAGQWLLRVIKLRVLALRSVPDYLAITRKIVEGVSDGN